MYLVFVYVKRQTTVTLTLTFCNSQTKKDVKRPSYSGDNLPGGQNSKTNPDL